MSIKVSILNKDRKSPGRLSGKGLSLLYTEGDGQTAGQERIPGMCRGREGPSTPPTLHIPWCRPPPPWGSLLGCLPYLSLPSCPLWATFCFPQPQEMVLLYWACSVAQLLSLLPLTHPIPGAWAALPAAYQSVVPPSGSSRMPCCPCTTISAGPQPASAPPPRCHKHNQSFMKGTEANSLGSNLSLVRR